MFQLPIFQIDAFTDRAFGGNPAAICPVPIMLSDSTLQAIAAENNLSETAFILDLPGDDEADYLLRWFTPALEVDLCGHATLAAAQVVFTHLNPDMKSVRFSTRSGVLTVERGEERHTLDFPTLKPLPMDIPQGLDAAMGAEPTAVLKSEHADRDLLLIYSSAEAVRSLTPNTEALKAFAPYGFIATAPGDGADGIDFVSRCFFPNHGIAEDPVTGSAHCVSGPYWAEKLGKTDLYAQQISARCGDLWLSVGQDRIQISGSAVEVMQGVLFIPD